MPTPLDPCQDGANKILVEVRRVPGTRRRRPIDEEGHADIGVEHTRNTGTRGALGAGSVQGLKVDVGEPS